MATTSGTVDYLKVGDDFGFVALREAVTNDLELFILWGFRDDPTAFQRIVQSSQLALLRDAMSGGLPVDVFHGDHSAFVDTVKVSRGGP